MSIENQIINIAKLVFNVSDEEVKIDHRFLGGMSNYTFLVFVRKSPYVIRILGEGGDVLVTPNIEKEHLNIVKSLDLTSQVIYFDSKTGIKVSEYVEGSSLTSTLEEKDVENIAFMLKTLHSKKLKGFDYDLKGRLRHYEKLLKNVPSFDYYILKMQWLKMYDEIYSNDEKVLCHGDAQRSNIIKNDERYYLLDWEFSGLNDPYYDLASFGNMGINDSISLLEKYLGRKPNSDEIKKLKFYRMYQVLQWHIVATYKHEINLSEKLHLDFNLISQKYLSIAKELYEDITALI